MLNNTIQRILTQEGPASFVTMGSDGPHMVATWNSYIQLNENDELLIPAGSLFQTELNIKQGSGVQLLIAAKGVQGMHGNGAGFLLKGTAKFENSGAQFEQVKLNFSWARAVMILHIREAVQLI
ncbi:FMN-binding protein [Alicyclobacillaceae bacterium I2511]|jgi:hypothetical protein|nr:FMN-binding protein [Alicyclobacillaceae bacterium I2511]